MTLASRLLCALAAFGIFASGCKTSDPEPERVAGDAPRRPPKTATLYVNSTGEPLEVGGKKAEKADADGHSTGEFSPKDLLVPGMFVLVSGAMSVGGALLIKAVDKKDRPAGPTYIASGGDDGTLVPMDTSGGSGTGAPGGPADGSATGSTPGGTGSGDPASGTGSTPGGTPATPGEAPELPSISAVASSSDRSPSKLLATGKAVASTPTSILLTMGYASGYKGPSYVTAKVTHSGKTTIHSATVYLYDWSLTLDRTKVSSGERVNVYATFDGLPESSYVLLRIEVYGGAKLVCDHTPIMPRIKADTLPPDGTWVFGESSLTPFTEPQSYGYLFKTPPPGTRVLLGYLTVSKDVDVFGDSTAVVTVH
ncbi:MAG: hypothetical protein K8T20_19275 [Planctomycetes bacterium]|nr:hypothetical protein [Planctomycetota bacterium]